MPDGGYDFVGCLSTEDRCLTSRLLCSQRVRLEREMLVCIADADSQYTDIIEEKLENNRLKYQVHGGNLDNVHDCSLLASRGSVVQSIDQAIHESGGNIVLDISTLPKRYFFCYIKRILASAKVRNFVVTNTLPLRYTQEELAENYSSWSPLPLFDPPFEAERHKHLIIAVGHTPMGLTDKVDALAKDVRVELLFPFPGTPKSFKATWEFVQSIEHALGEIKLKHINARDASETYNHFFHATNEGNDGVLFAPFGPKPFSLAMALFASKYNQSVCYTQPQVYHPDYSIGVLEKQGVPQTIGYVVRVEGRDLY